MERLTEWIDEETAVPRMDLRKNGHQRCTNKLAELEDLEENGRLIKILCKPGDTVYTIDVKHKICPHIYVCDDYDPEQFLVSWCEKYCHNGYKGIGIIKCKIREIIIEKDFVYYVTEECGYKKKEEIYLTKQEAQEAFEIRIKQNNIS